MAAPVFNLKSNYLGTSFVRQSDGLVSFYGNTVGVGRSSATRWTLSAINSPVTWNLAAAPAELTFVSSTSNTYTFDFVPTAEGDYSFTLEATNSDGTTSGTFVIGVGRKPNNGDFISVGPYDQWVYCKETTEQVIGPAFVGNSLGADGWTSPFGPGIALQINSSGAAAPGSALNINTGPSDIGYGVCPVGTYTVPMKGITNLPSDFVSFNVVFSVIDCSAGPSGDVTELIANTITLTDSVQNSNLDHAFLFSDTIALVQGGVSTQLTGINVPPPVIIIPPGEPLPRPNPTANPGANCIFEFYEMMHPEDVEVLPVPKKYDQLGPMRFDKIGKIFGFRVRLIQNGTIESMPYAIFGDDSESNPHLNSALFSGSFPVRPGFDNVYEIQLPKSINTDIFRLTLGPTTDSFHRYNVFVKVHISGMQGQAKWLPIR